MYLLGGLLGEDIKAKGRPFSFDTLYTDLSSKVLH